MTGLYCFRKKGYLKSCQNLRINQHNHVGFGFVFLRLEAFPDTIILSSIMQENGRDEAWKNMQKLCYLNRGQGFIPLFFGYWWILNQLKGNNLRREVDKNVHFSRQRCTDVLCFLPREVKCFQVQRFYFRLENIFSRSRQLRFLLVLLNAH